jgi:hypothetical protein
MAVGDYEAEVRDRPTRRALAAWGSVWLDLQTVGQMVLARQDLPAENAVDVVVVRRAVLDGALVTYGRCFTDGTRFAVADLLPLVAQLGEAGEAVHEKAMHWRHRHLAHRLDSELETTSVHYLWRNFAKDRPTIRVRVATHYEPPGETFSNELGDHCMALAGLVWTERMWPLKNEHLEAMGADRLRQIRDHHAVFYRSPSEAGDLTWGAAIDLGDDEP